MNCFTYFDVHKSLCKIWHVIVRQSVYYVWKAVIRLQAGQPKNVVQFPAGVRYSVLFQNIQTGSGVHSAYHIDTKCSFLGVRQPGSEPGH